MSDFWYLMQANISSLGSHASSVYWMSAPIFLVFFQWWVLKVWDMLPTRDKHSASRSWGKATLIWQSACTQAASALNSLSRQQRIYSLSLLQPPCNYTRNPTPLIITSQARSNPPVPQKESYFIPIVFKWKKYQLWWDFTLCRSAEQQNPCLVWVQHRQRGIGETNRTNTGKTKERSDPAKGSTGLKELPVLHRVRISAQVNKRNGDYLLWTPEKTPTIFLAHHTVLLQLI